MEKRDNLTPLRNRCHDAENQRRDRVCDGNWLEWTANAFVDILSIMKRRFPETLVVDRDTTRGPETTVYWIWPSHLSHF